MIVMVRGDGAIYVKNTYAIDLIYMVGCMNLLQIVGRTKVLEKKYMKKVVAKNPIPVYLS
jgi:hypothetical protein